MSAGAAAAHPRLVSSTPAAGAKVTAPSAVEMHFSEPLISAFSCLDITRSTMPGMVMKGDVKIAGVTCAVGADQKTLIATLRTALAPGAYRVAWHAVSIDTHRVEGAFAFTVK